MKHLYQELNDIENEFSKIYYEMVDLEDISIYKKNLYERKMCLLSVKLEKIVNEIIFSDRNKTNEIKKKIKKTTHLSLLAFVFLFINPIMSLPLYLFFLYRFIKLAFQVSKIRQPEKIDELIEKTHTIGIIVQNCDTFMNVKFNKGQEKLVKTALENDELLLNVELANQFLEKFLETGEKNYLSENVKTYLIKMLQEDLQTDISSLDELLEIAKDKSSYEKINNELSLKLKFIKNNLK